MGWTVWIRVDGVDGVDCVDRVDGVDCVDRVDRVDTVDRSGQNAARIPSRARHGLPDRVWAAFL